MKHKLIVAFLVVVSILLVLTLHYKQGIALELGKTVKILAPVDTGFVHPESVAYDPYERVVYVSQFGSKLKPTLKDGQGRISKMTTEGKIIEKQFLPLPGQTLNKPKGLWIEKGRLWVTDIDVIWVFDLQTRKGRYVELPNARFANDPVVIDQTLYVSDSIGKRIYRVKPADFLDVSNGLTVDIVIDELPFNPNGLYAAKNNELLCVGYSMDGSAVYGVYQIDAVGRYKELVAEIGSLDGLARLSDGSLLITDWKSGALAIWHPVTGLKILTKGIKGPADFTVIPIADGYRVILPDLVTSEVHLIDLIP